jgi:hydrogenase nickel incorporation protein HypA/HybF
MKYWQPMHELAICQALIGEVSAVARAKDASSVTDVYVSVGPLSGVEGPLMRNAFPIAAAGTVASQAALHLQRTPVRVSCEDCGAETEVSANRLICGCCSNWRTQLISGDELLLQRVVMQTNRQRENNDVRNLRLQSNTR